MRATSSLPTTVARNNVYPVNKYRWFTTLNPLSSEIQTLFLERVAEKLPKSRLYTVVRKFKSEAQ
jgi:hypothetical protein